MPETYFGLAPPEWQAVWLSVRISVAAVALSLPAGLALGWVLARKEFRGKALAETLLSLPLVLPPVVTGLLLLYVFGPKGWVGAWLNDAFGLQIAFTWKAAVIAVAVMGFPLLVRAVRMAYEATDPRLFQAARSLGAGPFDAFYTVVLPLARNGIIAGIVLAFARGLGEFGATVMFASIRPETTTLAVQAYVLHNQPGEAPEERMWRVVAASVLLAFAALVASEYLARRGRRHESA
jgi:molybdate transport system permease protein